MFRYPSSSAHRTALTHVGPLGLWSLVEMPLPVAWHATFRSRHRLIERVVSGRGQLRAVEVLLCRVVPEPVLARLVTLNDGVRFAGGMVTCVLRRGRVTAADVSTTRAAAQVEPPTAAGEAFDTSRTARCCCWINVHSGVSTFAD